MSEQIKSYNYGKAVNITIPQLQIYLAVSILNNFRIFCLAIKYVSKNPIHVIWWMGLYIEKLCSLLTSALFF